MSVIPHNEPILTRLASYWGRSAGMITITNLLAQVLALASTLVLAFFLSLSQYGHYALAAFFASMAAIVLNAGTLQGTMMVVFGGGGDDDDGADDDHFLDDLDDIDPRRTLTSTLVFTVVMAGVFVAIVWVFATPLTHLLLGSHSSRILIVLAAVAGGVNAVWRYMVNVPRMERRIGVYCFHRLFRPISVTGAIVVMMITVGGIRGALLALSTGTLLALGVLLAGSWRSYRLAVSIREFARAARFGAPYVPINISVGFVHSAGVFLLAGYRSAAEVGRFSIASSAAAVNSHYISGLLTSFSPVRRTTLFKAAELAEEERLRNRVVTVFVTTTLAFGVAIALLADELIRVLPRSYHGAANVIPFALLGWTTYGIYMVVYRMTTHDHKRLYYVLASVLSLGSYVGFSALLDPGLGAIGQALAMCLTYTVNGIIMVFVSQGGEDPLQLDGLRLVSATVLAGGCVLGFHELADLVPSARLLIDLAGIASYLAAVVVLRIVPWSMVLTLFEACRGMLPKHGIIRDVQRGIRRLPPTEASVLLALGHGKTPRELAERVGMTEQEFELRTVAGLRALSGLGGPRASDIRVGAYLLSPLSRAERDVLARRLQEEVDPDELHLLESSFRLVRRAVRRDTARPRRGHVLHRRRPVPPPQSAAADPTETAPLQPGMP